MKNKMQLVIERRNKLFHTISNDPELTITELAEHFRTSEITIRRDLQALQKENKIELFFGGYKVIQSESIDLITCCRTAIARYAASLVEDNDIIFINTSSTAISMISYISAKNVTVITNNGKAINMEFPHSVSVYLTGGEIRNPKSALVGDMAMRTIREIRVHKSFLGCTGLSIQEGMTTKNANEVNINSLMLENATISSYILADFTKFNAIGNFTSCPTPAIRNIITDSCADESTVQQFREAGINIIRAK